MANSILENSIFLLVISIYLLITYKKSIFKSFYDSGLPGFFGGLILSFGFCGYVFAMYNTTVANTNFIIQTQTIFLSNIWIFFFERKNFKSYLDLNCFSCIWNYFNGWKHIIARTNAWKYSCLLYANFFCCSNTCSKKISKC